MIESGVGSPSSDQIVLLAALAVMLGTAYSLDKISSPKPNPGVGNPGEQTELLKKFMELNPEAQRGVICYIEQMRKGYKNLTN